MRPTHKIQLASYSSSLSHEWSLRARERFREWGPIVHGVKLSTMKSAMGDWKTEKGGGVFAAGVDGSFNGRGSQCGILDDPHKNWQEAQSRTVKDHAWNWFRSSFITRLAPGAPIIIISTRWAKDDISGRAMDMWDAEGKPYVRLKFKAIAEDDDPILKRKRGEPLWPESGRDVQFYNDKLAEVGPLIFDCLFQQEPGRGEGSLFRPERFRYYYIQGDYFVAEGNHVLISDCRFFMAIDLASRTKEQNDYTVMGVFARSPTNDLFWVHVFRDRISTVHHLSKLQELIGKFRATRYVLIEDVQYQQSFVDGAIQAGLPAVAVQADRDKFTRAIPLATMYYNGKVFHLKGAKWTRPLEEELVAFSGDGSSHDDQVDVGAYAAISIVEQGAAPTGVYVG